MREREGEREGGREGEREVGREREKVRGSVLIGRRQTHSAPIAGEYRLFPPQIEHLKQQLSQQDSGKRAQGEELDKLRVQLETLKKEEREYRQKVRGTERGREGERERG